jgi:hypothetical protein
MSTRRELRELPARLSHPPTHGSFSTEELEGLADPVRRSLTAAMAPGTPLARSALVRMRGSIKLGRRWVPFSAHEVLAPHDGFVWAGRAARVIVGSDRYVNGWGAMDWKLLGVIRVAHADGPDVSRSAAGRAAGEAVWVPTSLLPRFGVEWSAVDPHQVTASFGVDATQFDIRYTLDDDARVVAVVFDRWGDPKNEGPWAYRPRTTCCWPII